MYATTRTFGKEMQLFSALLLWWHSPGSNIKHQTINRLTFLVNQFFFTELKCVAKLLVRWAAALYGIERTQAWKESRVQSSEYLLSGQTDCSTSSATLFIPKPPKKSWWAHPGHSFPSVQLPPFPNRSWNRAGETRLDRAYLDIVFSSLCRTLVYYCSLLTFLLDSSRENIKMVVQTTCTNRDTCTVDLCYTMSKAVCIYGSLQLLHDSCLKEEGVLHTVSDGKALYSRSE